MVNRKLCLSQRGIQFLDLLLFISIVLVLVPISIPGTGALLGYGQLSQESKRLAAHIERLAIRATKSKQPILLILQKGGYYAVIDDLEKTQISFTELKAPISIQISGGSKQELSLHPSGSASPQTIVLTDQKNRCRVSVSLRSRVTVLC